MLDFIYHITFNLLLNHFFGVKLLKILSLCMQCCYGSHNIKFLNMITSSGLLSCITPRNNVLILFNLCHL